MRKCSTVRYNLVFLLAAFVAQPSFASTGPVCEVYSGTSETSRGPIISISAKCEGYGDWVNLSPQAILEQVIVSPDNNPKTFSINVEGFRARDIPFMWDSEFGDFLVQEILSADPTIRRMDNVRVVLATFQAGTRIYRDTRLLQEVIR